MFVHVMSKNKTNCFGIFWNELSCDGVTIKESITSKVIIFVGQAVSALKHSGII